MRRHKCTAMGKKPGGGASPQDQGIPQRPNDPTGRQEEQKSHPHPSKEEDAEDQRG